jgi:hypothetical protein
VKTYQLLQELIAAELRLLRQPIDFEELECLGILSRESTWYRLCVPLTDLPDHAAHKIRELAQYGGRTYLRFYK